jgi:hypothetical protein
MLHVGTNPPPHLVGPEQSTSLAQMVHECSPAIAAELGMAEPDALTMPWQLPSMPVAHDELPVPAATLRVVAPPALPHVAAPKRLLQIWLVRAAVLTATALVAAAGLGGEGDAGRDGGKLGRGGGEDDRARPDGPQSKGPTEEVASTSAQDVDWPAH